MVTDAVFLMLVTCLTLLGLPFTDLLWPRANTKILRFALACGMGIAFFLAGFVIFLPLSASTTAAGFLSLGTVAFVSLGVNQKSQWHAQRFALQLRLEAPWLWFAVVVFALFTFLRSRYPALHWQNDLAHFGSEKLFNLMQQQSFVFAQNYPTENLWLSGQNLNYYALLRALPGFISAVWVNLLHGAPGAGHLFLMTDVFYTVLTVWMLASFSASLLLLRKTHRLQKPAVFWGFTCGVGLFPFLQMPFTSAFQAIANGKLDFWGLQNVIPFAYTEYPLWIFLLGDGHSNFHAIFLIVTLVFSSFLLFSSRLELPAAIVWSLLLCTLLHSHAPSLLSLGLVVFVAFMLNASWLLQQQNKLRIFLTAGSLFLICYALFSARIPLPSVTWVSVERGIASPLWAFFNAHGLVFGLVAATFLFTITTKGVAAFGPPLAQRELVAITFLATCLFLTLVSQRFALAAVIGIVGLFVLLKRSGSSQHSCSLPFRADPLIFAIASLVLIVFPEIFVADLAADGRTQWVRFNTLKKFWLEFFFVFPLFALPALWPLVHGALTRPWVRRVGAVTGTICLVTFVGAALLMAKNRVSFATEDSSFDGLDFLKTDAPHDAVIAAYLTSISQRVVVAETCGFAQHPLAPTTFGAAGRMAVLSARSSPCGWARHVWLWQPTFRGTAFESSWIWPFFQSYTSALDDLYGAASLPQGDLNDKNRVFSMLIRSGVTHIVIGDLEQKIYQNRLNLHRLAQLTHGTVTFKTGDGRYGVVALYAQLDKAP